MVINEYESAQAFLNDYETLLLKQEATSQLILYNAYQNLNIFARETCFFGAVLDEEKTILLLCNVAPYNLVVYALDDPDKEGVISALEALVDFIINNQIMIKGINARLSICQNFTEQYKKRVNCKFVEALAMDILEIRYVNDIKTVDGLHRLATYDEVKLITDWIIQYQMEDLASELDYEDALRKASNLIRDNRLYVFENNENKIVSMAAISRQLVHGIAISYIFTPEKYRGEGYAAANVFYLSKLLLDYGFDFCTIFADKKNIVAIRAYEKVGYYLLEEIYDYKLMIEE